MRNDIRTTVIEDTNRFEMTRWKLVTIAEMETLNAIYWFEEIKPAVRLSVLQERIELKASHSVLGSQIFNRSAGHTSPRKR